MTDETERRTERIPLLMRPSEVKALDDWAFANRIRGRGEAIRRLIEAGLNATENSAVASPPARGKGMPLTRLGRDVGENSAPTLPGADQTEKSSVASPASSRQPSGQIGHTDQAADTTASKPRRPRAKPLAMSKEAQIRALRERGG